MTDETLEVLAKRLEHALAGPDTSAWVANAVDDLLTETRRARGAEVERFTEEELAYALAVCFNNPRTNHLHGRRAAVAEVGSRNPRGGRVVFGRADCRVCGAAMTTRTKPKKREPVWTETVWGSGVVRLRRGSEDLLEMRVTDAGKSYLVTLGEIQAAARAACRALNAAERMKK